MPRRPCTGTARFVFHVYNRAIEGASLCESADDYELFMRILAFAVHRKNPRLLSYAAMKTHWHLVVWPPTDDSLSRFVHLVAMTHAMHLRKRRGTSGRGAVYQGRFRAIPVQADVHLLRLCSYVERNPLKKRLVERAEEWPWSSASPLAFGPDRPELHSWPIPKPPDWLELLDAPLPSRVHEDLRCALRQGRPYGDEVWQEETRCRLGWKAARERNGEAGLLLRPRPGPDDQWEEPCRTGEVGQRDRP